MELQAWNHAGCEAVEHNRISRSIRHTRLIGQRSNPARSLHQMDKPQAVWGGMGTPEVFGDATESKAM